MAEQTRQMHFITARDLPVAIALDDVTYTDALAAAGQCIASGQLLSGPDGGSVGYIVNFDQVVAVTVSSRKPTGPVMQMPAELIETLVAESADGLVFNDDPDPENDHQGSVVVTAPRMRQIETGPPEVWEFTGHDPGAVFTEAGQWLARCEGTPQERHVRDVAFSPGPESTLRLTVSRRGA